MTHSRSEESHLPLVEVAEILGTTPVNLLLLIKRGQLVGYESAEGWLVDRSSLDDFRNSEAGESGKAPCRSACSRAGNCGSCE